MVQKIFTKDDVLTEIACMPGGTCNVDQIAFRAILARGLAPFKSLVDSGRDAYINISKILTASAKAAGAQCTGGSNGTSCGSDWTASHYDGSTGLSEDLSALNIMLANLPQKFSGSSSNSSSSSNGTASSGSDSTSTSSGDASGTSGEANSSSTPDQQGENVGDQRAASMFGLLGALGFAVAFFL